MTDRRPITDAEALTYLRGLQGYVQAAEQDDDYVLPDDAATMLWDLIAREERALAPITSTPTRVLVALDVPSDQAENVPDLLASVVARVADEAGYLDSGDPVMPERVVATVVNDSTPLTAATLRGAYEVGIEGAPC